MKNIKFK